MNEEEYERYERQLRKEEMSHKYARYERPEDRPEGEEE
tara:strand:+ start:1262 stop:1375 length:114 start_codon:yes stop_codon:yes gene_type:complete